MKRARPQSFGFLLSAISLSALGLVHCGSDDEPGPAGDGGSSSAGKGGTAGGAGKGGSGGGNQSSGGTGGAGSGDAGAGGESESMGGSDASDAGQGPGGQVGHGGEHLGGAGGEGGAAPTAVLHSILIGTFAPLPAYAGQTFAGRALLYRTLAGGTVTSIQLTGLTAATAYGSHVHNQPCSVLAGGHYLIDPAAAAAETNEIWLPFTTDATGVGFVEVTTAGHLARGDALSIVVHDPAAANAKMACADLGVGSDGELTASGTFAAFAAAELIDNTIAGSVELVRGAAGTAVTLDVSGLDAASAYHCHVHALPCSVMTAGGHYKIDPTNAATEAGNELWPALGDTADAAATGLTSFVHRARFDAQSVVIHRSANAVTPKVACADLNVENYPNVESTGLAALLPAATPNYTSLTANAELVRTLAGTTSLHVVASGLVAGTTYPIHVHDRPCGIQNGGGHYLRDKAGPAAEMNELWLPVTANAQGEVDAETAASHIAAADARSLVIHDPGSNPVNARLACIDLE